MKFQKHNARKLEANQIVRVSDPQASYYSFKEEVYKIISFEVTNLEDKTVESFKSAKELYKHYNVRGLKALEEVECEKDIRVRIVVKDIDTQEQGGWLYIYEGRWSIGSGAQSVRFELGITDEEFENALKAKEAKEAKERIERQIENKQRRVNELLQEIEELKNQL